MNANHVPGLDSTTACLGTWCVFGQFPSGHKVKAKSGQKSLNFQVKRPRNGNDGLKVDGGKGQKKREDKRAPNVIV